MWILPVDGAAVAGIATDARALELPRWLPFATMVGFLLSMSVAYVIIRRRAEAEAAIRESEKWERRRAERKSRGPNWRAEQEAAQREDAKREVERMAERARQAAEQEATEIARRAEVDAHRAEADAHRAEVDARRLRRTQHRYWFPD
ncbi:hypothetical protein [Actinomadura sp. 3N407]|uniref:hypothetical protein n=1 Tax=Actinomadura sp. 3N407 TaxID=3457423 RepID=UPI003FCC9891